MFLHNNVISILIIFNFDCHCQSDAHSITFHLTLMVVEGSKSLRLSVNNQTELSYVCADSNFFLIEKFCLKYLKLLLFSEKLTRFAVEMKEVFFLMKYVVLNCFIFFVV